MTDTKMKYPVRALLLAVCTAFGLSAYAEPVTLTVAVFPVMDQVIKADIPAWKKLHPDVDIKIVSREYADHHSAMTIALATGASQVDVMALEMDRMGRFAEGGGLEDISKPPYNARQYQNKFAGFTFPVATANTGELVGFPTDIAPGTLFYRQDILKKADVKDADLTRSWESYIESGKKIKAKTGAYLLAHARDIQRIVIRANLKDGEGIFFDKNGKILVESPRFVKAFELAKAVRDAKLDAKINSWSNEWTESFKRGTVATQMMGAWLGGHLAHTFAPDAKGAWRVDNLPNGAFASWGGTFYSIPKKSNNKAMAWEFIKFMTLDKTNQLEAFKGQDNFPALIEAQNDAYFDQPIEYFGGQKPRAMWREAARHIPALDVNKYDPVANEIVGSELDKVLDHGKDIKAALADAKALIERRAHR